MSAPSSKCYVNRTGFRDDTAYVEVFADGYSIVHTRNGQKNAMACSFEHPITNGDWVEIENPATRKGEP